MLFDSASIIQRQKRVAAFNTAAAEALTFHANITYHWRIMPVVAVTVNRYADYAESPP